MNQIEMIKQSFEELSDQEKLAELDETRSRSNSYYSASQLEMLDELGKILYKENPKNKSSDLNLSEDKKPFYNTSNIRREAVRYFFNKVETGEFQYIPKEDFSSKMILVNGFFTKGDIAKCKRIAAVFKISSAQIRRDAVELYYSNVVNGKIKLYENQDEFLGNIQNDELKYD